jgi:hypothetical protein
VDEIELETLARFEERADDIADEIAACTVAEVDGFGPINDGRLRRDPRSRPPPPGHPSRRPRGG